MFWYGKNSLESHYDLKKCALELKPYETLNEDNLNTIFEHSKQYFVRWENPKTFFISVLTYRHYRLFLKKKYAVRSTFKVEISGTSSKPIFVTERIVVEKSIWQAGIFFALYAFVLHYLIATPDSVFWLNYYYTLTFLFLTGYLIYPFIDCGAIGLLVKTLDAREVKK